MIDEVVPVLERLRARRPLIHCLTNQVVKNFTANALLAIGAAPAMVEHPEEAAEFAAMADAVLVNLGTLDECQMAAIRGALPSARKAGKPWVLDPVAVGPLGVRTRFAREILAYGPALIRGNASEIIALAGMAGRGRGVDSGDSSDRALDAARQLAGISHCAVLVSGQTDYATDGRTVIACSNGDALLTRVTGVGCAQGAIAAACVVVADNPLHAAAAAAVIMGIAGERAAAVSRRVGSFQIALLDALDGLDGAAVRAQGRLA